MNAHARNRFKLASLCLAMLGVVETKKPAVAEELAGNLLRDRDNGATTSLLGSFVRKGEWMAYTFYEFERDSTAGYTGEDLGFEGDEEYVGQSTEHQAIMLLAWGVTPDLAIEFEAAFYQRATLERDPDDDTTGMPDRFSESRYGALEAQLHWRIATETEHRPEFFANLEVGPPDAGDMVLLGNSDWEAEAGLGAIKALPWGTMAVRASVAYDAGDGEIEMGEYAIEYCRRLTPSCRIAAALIGEPDELSLLSEVQWRFRENAFTRINVALGVTDEAPDFGGQFGAVFSF
jgi:hypothetical protein